MSLPLLVAAITKCLSGSASKCIIDSPTSSPVNPLSYFFLSSSGNLKKHVEFGGSSSFILVEYTVE
jgi:hypothetical protein